MKIRFLTRVSSSIHGSHKPGDIFDWKDEKEAKQLIAAATWTPEVLTAWEALLAELAAVEAGA